jgi:hypothetical protein
LVRGIYRFPTWACGQIVAEILALSYQVTMPRASAKAHENMTMADDPDIPEKGYKGGRFTTLEKAGRKRNRTYNDWRKKLQLSKVAFDDHKKGIYLAHLAKHGRKMQACLAAGVSRETVARHIEADPEFLAARQEALDQYTDKVQELAWKLMSGGVSKPLIGVDKGTSFVVAYEKLFATNLLAMEMRKTNPEYKDRSEVDVKGGGGIVIAPAGISSEAFIKQEEERNKDKKEPGADE